MEASGEEVAEKGADGDAGHEVAVFGDGGGLGAGVIAEGGVVEAAAHVILKGNGTIFGDFLKKVAG